VRSTMKKHLLAGVLLASCATAPTGFAQNVTPGAPGNPGTPVSPSQIPESQRLRPEATPPQGLQTPGSQLPSGQTLGTTQAATPVATTQSLLLRQGTTDERQLAVYERALPDYDPVGLQVGSFYLFPSVVLGLGYDSNIFAAPHKTGDQTLTLAPKLSVRSNFEEDQLNLDVSSANGFFMTHDSENYGDYQVSGNTRYYLTPTIVAFGKAGIAHLHEARDSPNAQSPTEPTEYNDYTAYAGLAQTGLELQLQGDVYYERLKFQSVATPAGLASNGFRDRDQVIGTLRAGYEFSRQLVGFVRGAANNRSYLEHEQPGGFTRNSKGFAADVGVDLDLNSIFVAEVFGGVLHQEFSDSRFGSVTPVDIGLDAVWNLTPRASLTFDVLRSIDETTLLVPSPSSAILTTTVATGAQYQFLPNLQGRIDYSHSFLDFQNTAFLDNVDILSVGANYFIGRNIIVKPSLSYSTRNTNRAASDFDRLQGIIAVTLQY
jgi:hypothetical protein